MIVDSNRTDAICRLLCSLPSSQPFSSGPSTIWNRIMNNSRLYSFTRFCMAVTQASTTYPTQPFLSTPPASRLRSTAFGLLVYPPVSVLLSAPRFVKSGLWSTTGARTRSLDSFALATDTPAIWHSSGGVLTLSSLFFYPSYTPPSSCSSPVPSCTSGEWTRGWQSCLKS